jgi:hypothetical protein
MPIIRSSRLYVCVFAAYGVSCLAVGCRGSGVAEQVVRPGRGMLQHPYAPHLTPDNQQPTTTHHRWQIHTYSLELMMMGIEVPETF